MDIVFVSELKLDALIGIYAWERTVPQAIQIDLELEIDASASARSLDVAHTVDYARVVARVREVVTARHHALLEELAEELAALVLSEFGTPRVKVSIAKLAALPGVKRLGVVIERTRNRP